MDEGKNAFAEQVNGNDEGNSGAVDPGYVNEHEAQEEARENEPQEEEGYTEAVRKRIHAQAKKHQREMRDMQQQMMHMQAQIAGADSANPSNHQSDHYQSPGQPNPPAMSEDERIQKAVRYALGAKENEERQAKEAEHQTHVNKHYERLNNEFDSASEKYHDFDDVVRGHDAPFTPHMRDALLVVENPAEVAYKLGKNRSELERISKLHPLDQVREVNKLSHSLVGGNGKPSSQTKANPLGAVKGGSTHSGAVTDKTPASTIRARMKAGTWK